MRSKAACRLAITWDGHGSRVCGYWVDDRQKLKFFLSATFSNPTFSRRRETRVKDICLGTLCSKVLFRLISSVIFPNHGDRTAIAEGQERSLAKGEGQVKFFHAFPSFVLSDLFPFFQWSVLPRFYHEPTLEVKFLGSSRLRQTQFSPTVAVSSIAQSASRNASTLDKSIRPATARLQTRQQGRFLASRPPQLTFGGFQEPGPASRGV